MVTWRYARVYTSCFPVFASACFLFFSSFCTYQPVPYQGVHNVSCLRLVVHCSRQACMTTPASFPLVSSSCLLPVVPGSCLHVLNYIDLLPRVRRRPVVGVQVRIILTYAVAHRRRTSLNRNHPRIRRRLHASLACVARIRHSHTSLRPSRVRIRRRHRRLR